MKVLYKSYKDTLKSTGFLETRNNLLDQQQDLVNYTLKYLAPKKESQKAAWRKILNSNNSNKDIVLPIEFLLFVSISNATMEILFLLINRESTIGRASLMQTQSNSSLQILMEGSTVANFDPMPDHSRSEGALDRVWVIQFREPSADTEQI